MALFTCEGMNYEDACNLIKDLKEASIESNITTGGVSILAKPEQITLVSSICEKAGVVFNPGKSTKEVDFLLKHGEYSIVEKTTNDALSVIEEWQ